MSEKRFFKAYFTKQIIDKVTDKCYPIRDGESIDELVDLLNYQDRLIEEQHDEIINWTKKYVGIKKENEQLREILKDSVGATDETYTKKYKYVQSYSCP